MDNAPDILVSLILLIEVLEELGVQYHIGGSVASSIYGIPRLTIDIDIIADLHQEHVRPLVTRLQSDIYISPLLQLLTLSTSQAKTPANYSPLDSPTSR